MPASHDSIADAATAVAVVETQVPVAPFPPVFQPPPAAMASGRAFGRRPTAFARLWQKLGGGGLTLSLLIHAGLFVAAGLVVLATQMQETQVDFLPGGGTQKGAQASEALSHQIQQKQRKALKRNMPAQRIVANRMDANVVLPDAPVDLLDVPDVASAFGGALRGGGGFGRGGSGGGFGNGSGLGGLSGVTFKPIMMFGVELKDARKIAVVMDVSRSMTKYLPLVVKELDKVAHGSPLVLYFGCGLKKPPRGLDDKIRKTSSTDFDKFWYYWQGKEDMQMLRKDYAKLKYMAGTPMPLDSVYQQMAKRPNTFFIDFNGITYTSPALTCTEVMQADTIYWFSDFQDAVEEEHIEDVMKRLRGRKQKLYIHASTRGRSFEMVREKLVKPLGGDVIETKAE